MFIAKNEDLIILANDSRDVLEQQLQFMVYDTIEETEEDYQLCDGKYLTKDERIARHKTQFNKDFFNTSLGYIRRKVSMANGETKDFLSDLLPTISMGVTSGVEVKVIAYNEPDFTKEVIDWEALQHNEVVTAQFIQECFLQLSSDFGGVNEINN